MAIILGSSGANSLNGTAQSDIILGLQGADTINAGGGNDLVDAGTGNDSVWGGAGDDILFGGAGNDTLDGGTGSDLVAGGEGNDVLVYNIADSLGGCDLYDGDAGQDTLRILVSQAVSQQAGFIADIARLKAKLAAGYGSYSFQSIGLTVLSIEKLEVVVQGGANQAPVAKADTVAAVEDTGLVILKSTLLANDTDADAGDTKTLVSVQGAQNGTVSLNAAGDVVFVAAANFSGVASFIYTMRDTAGATSTATVAVNVAAVADAPTLSVGAANGAEDGAIGLTIASALVDTDGSETLAITIAGVQAGASLNRGVRNADGSYSLAAADLAGLALTPPASFAGSLSLTVTATSRETSNGTTANTTATLAVSIAAVADAPTLTVAAASGAEDSAIALTIASALTDTDGSETLTIGIAGLPAGASLNHGVRNADGSYTLSKADLAGLLLTPPANLSGNVALTVTATSREASNGATASTSAALAVAIAAVADAPTLTVAPASGAEDGAIALSITSALTDTDGSEVLSLTIAGLPAGASLNRGIAQADGSYRLDAADLAGLTLTPPANFSGSISLAITATSRETANGATATTTSNLAVTVAAVADAPTLSVQPASGDEDAAIALNIASALTDTDGSEVLSLTITGLPAGASLNHGIAQADGSYLLSPAQLAGLTLTPPTNFAGEIALSVIASSRESANGAIASTTASLAVTVAPVADAAAITLAPAAGDTGGAPIPLGIAVAVTDPSETIGAIRIAGVPDSYALNAGTVDGAGVWTLTPAQLTGLALIADSGAELSPGGFTLTVSATTIDGASTAITSASLPITIAATANQSSGFAIDGYIAGATVFKDANDNGVLDPGEARAITNASGGFTITGGSGNLVMFGGIDTSTGAAFAGVLKAPSGSTVVTPLTTLVAAIGGDVAAAQAAVKASLGIAPGVDLTTYDAVAATVAGDANGAAVLGAAVQVQTTVTQIAAATGGGAAAVVAALANTLTASVPIDLTSAATLGGIVTTVSPTANPAAVAQVSAVIAAANGSVADAAASGDALGGIAQAAQVALGATTQALASAGLDAAALTTVVTSYTGAALDTQVAAAPVADVDGPTLGTLGADTLAGTAGVDAIDGLDGADSISGGAGNDLLYGGGGTDTLRGGTGDDRIDGGTGLDRAFYDDAGAAISVSLASGLVTGGAGADTLVSVEGVRGTAFGDVFSAAGYTAFTGYASGRNDQGSFNEFAGAGGDDTFVGNGNTRLSYFLAAAAVTVNLTTRSAGGAAPGDLAQVGNDSIGAGVNQIRGSAFDDTIIGSANGSATTEVFDGAGGNDLLDGNQGFDRVRYDLVSTGALGITVNLGAGIVTGRDAAATAVVGLDTLRSIESIFGSSAADIVDASGFTGPTVTVGSPSANNGGDQGNFVEFEGKGGDDTLIGNGNTRIAFSGAAAGVLVSMSAGVGAGTATGDASVGNDSFTGVTAIRGSAFNDTIIGSDNGNTVTEQFEGFGGDDSIMGGAGFDRARYDVNLVPAGLAFPQGVNIVMASGLVTGRDATATAFYGADTLRGIEAVRGTVAADFYDARNFGAAGFLDPLLNNVNNNGTGGTFNEFEGGGGADTVIGNGNTRIAFSNAGEGVLVDLPNARVIGGASVGTDSLSGGFSQVNGSGFADTMIGGNGNTSFSGANGNDSIIGGGGNESLSGGNGDDTLSGGAGNDSLTGDAGNDSLAGDGGNEFLFGGAGDDTLDGGAGVDVAIYGGFARAQATITDLGGGVLQVVVDGTDRLSNVEVLRFNDGAILTSATVSLVGRGGIGTNVAIFGGAGADVLTIDTGTNGNPIDLGAGTDTLILGATNGVYTSPSLLGLALSGIEIITGSVTNDALTIGTTQTGIAIDLGAGSDTLSLTAFGNTGTIRNVESVTTGGGNDIVTVFQSTDQAATTIDLGAGTDSLTLAANGTGVTTVSVRNTETILGSAANDAVTLASPILNASIDLAGGTNSVILGAVGVVSYSLALANVASVTDLSGATSLVLLNGANGLSVNLGSGADTLGLAGTGNTITVSNAETLNAFGAGNDVVNFIPDGSSNQTINLGAGTDVLTIGGASGALSMSISGGSGLTVNLQTTAVSESLNLLNQQFGATYDFGAGSNDSLTLFSGAGTNLLTVRNLETLTGSASGDNVTYFQDPLSAGASINLGFGTDTLNLGAGTNIVSVVNVESITGANPFNPINPGIGDDTVTFTPTSGFSATVSLGVGTDILNIVGDNGAVGLSLFVAVGEALTVNLATSAIDETLTLGLGTELRGAVFDFGAGANDRLITNDVGSVFSVRNTEFVVAGSAADAITVLGNNPNATTIFGGANPQFAAAGDTMTGSAGEEHFAFNGAGDSPVGGQRDVVIGFDAAADRFSFEDSFNGLPTGFLNPITYLGTANFSGAFQPEARITDLGGLDVLQIDVNGDGTVGAGDMEIQLINLAGTLSNANFLIV